MSDDLDKKIKQITDMLGQDTLPDNIKGLLNLLATASGKEETPAKTNEVPAVKNEKTERSELDENMEIMRRVKRVMDKLNSNNDPRVNLLTAIKPFLNTRRQKKVSDCIKLLQMSSLVKLMEDNDK